MAGPPIRGIARLSSDGRFGHLISRFGPVPGPAIRWWVGNCPTALAGSRSSGATRHETIRPRRSDYAVRPVGRDHSRPLGQSGPRRAGPEAKDLHVADPLIARLIAAVGPLGGGLRHVP